MGNEKFFKISADTRWKIIAQDPGQWRIGIYKPEYTSEKDIHEFEKHTCPELFICADGAMGIITFENGVEEVKILKPGEAAMLSGYHNGFCASENGYFIVAERTSFTTEFIDRKTGNFIRSEGA